MLVELAYLDSQPGSDAASWGTSNMFPFIIWYRQKAFGGAWHRVNAQELGAATCPVAVLGQGQSQVQVQWSDVRQRGDGSLLKSQKPFMMVVYYVSECAHVEFCLVNGHQAFCLKLGWWHLLCYPPRSTVSTSKYKCLFGALLGFVFLLLLGFVLF